MVRRWSRCSNSRLRKVDPDDYDNKGGKSGTHTRPHLVEKILEQDKLDGHGLVLFALLSGGNYAMVAGSLWTRDCVESCTAVYSATTLPSGHQWYYKLEEISP